MPACSIARRLAACGPDRLTRMAGWCRAAAARADQQGRYDAWSAWASAGLTLAAAGGCDAARHQLDDAGDTCALLIATQVECIIADPACADE